MFCIDWNDDPIEVGGLFTEADYSRLEVVLVPCNYLHTDLGFEGDYVSSECIRDL